MLHERSVRPRYETKLAAPPAAVPSGPVLTQFFNAMLVTERGLVQGDLWMLGDKLVDPQSQFWERSAKAVDRRVDCQGMLLAPGMIDVMLYGAFGVDFSRCAEADAEAQVASKLAMVRRRLPELGITAFCPAVRPCAPADCARAIQRLGKTARLPPPSRDVVMGEETAWAQCLGVHLDGPFLDAAHAASTGSSAEHVRSSLEGHALDEACGGRALEATLITLAPELPGALPAIRRLVAAGVGVGLGRTEATLAQCYDAVAAGARLVTQVMSAMPPFKHRDPGPVGLLADGRVGAADAADADAAKAKAVAPPWPAIRSATGTFTGAPGDLFFSLAVANLHSCSVNLVHGANPRGIVLLSDLGSSSYDAEAADASLGAIPSCARQLYLKTGAADPSAAILCGSAHPACLLRLPNKGRLTAGADADLVMLDPDDLSVKACYVSGQLAWSHPNLRGALWFHA